eukprot:Tbor_TRINITY_DN6130_c0_g1::TRINITY_DN6130_c0_g1_i17::g.21755::m.21755/K00432/gpx; glutathione peroxidase
MTMTMKSKPRSIYQFVVKDAKNEPFDLKTLEGKAVLIVSVASKCDYAKQGYEAAMKLYNKYKDTGKFTVIAFPCNHFGGQEYESEEQIREFACTNFNVDFPILAKVNVDENPLWKYLQLSAPGLLGSLSIKWNFTSFLCDTNGVPKHRYSPRMSRLIFKHLKGR